MPNTKLKTLERRVFKHVEQDSTVYTDTHGSYIYLHERYDHDVIAHSLGEYARGGVHTNSIESVWATFKGGYHGIYHQWRPKNTHRYAREFAFRLTTPNVVEAIDLLIDGAIGKRLTYDDLTKG